MKSHSKTFNSCTPNSRYVSRNTSPMGMNSTLANPKSTKHSPGNLKKLDVLNNIVDKVPMKIKTG